MKQLAVKVVIAVGVVLIGSMLIVWYSLHQTSVAAGLEQGVRRIVKQHPTLEPMLDRATADRVLTMSEVNAIVSAAENLKAR